MCGIVGVLGFHAREREKARRSIDVATGLLRHRGPNASGTWIGDGVALGHTRLSIIDLTDGGRQPMHDVTGRWTLIYNGEVYNYLELRDQLRHRGFTFRSASDTEVVLAALIAWGDAALTRFNGMWALALWDAEREELFLARDRVGKKPLYHTRLPDGTLAFGSEITPLLRLGAPRNINPQAAFDFLTQGTYGHLGEETFFAGILQIPAAHCARVRAGQPVTVRRYWDVPDVRAGDLAPYDSTFRGRFRELLTDSVRLRLRSDVPVGATLSGGLDSSALVLLVDEITQGAPLHLFTSQFPGTRFDESPYFDAVAARLKKPIVHRTKVDEASWREDLLCVLKHQEEPFGDTSILAHATLMKAARAAGVPVILSGQGGDELLLGYPSMVTAYLGSQLAGGRLGAAIEAIRWTGGGANSVSRLRNVLGATLPLGIRDRIRQRYVAKLAERVSPALREQASLARFDLDGRSSFNSYLRQVLMRFALPHLTHYDDRNAMAVSVEGRMPFLDVRLIELMFSVRGEAFLSGGLTKRVLRESCADLLPPIVRDRRDKIGFYTPLASWLLQHRDWVSAFMSHDRLHDAGMLIPQRYTEVLRRLERRHLSDVLEVWRGFILHLWADQFDVRTPDSLRAIADRR